MDRESHPFRQRGNMEIVDEFESREILEHGSDPVENQEGKPHKIWKKRWGLNSDLSMKHWK